MPVEGPRVWKTKDGTLVEVSAMGDTHLMNTVRYLLRRETERLESLGLAAQAASCAASIRTADAMLRAQLVTTTDIVATKFATQAVKVLPLRDVPQFPWMVAELFQRQMWDTLMKLQREFGSLLYVQKVGRMLDDDDLETF